MIIKLAPLLCLILFLETNELISSVGGNLFVESKCHFKNGIGMLIESILSEIWKLWLFKLLTSFILTVDKHSSTRLYKIVTKWSPCFALRSMKTSWCSIRPKVTTQKENVATFTFLKLNKSLRCST